MAISRDAARRWAQATVVFVLMVGALLVAREAFRPESTLGPSETTTTTKTVTERRPTPQGIESTETKEVTAAPKDTAVERALGLPGVWLGRILLFLLIAFFSGGLVQRALLGEFQLKAGPFELPPLPVAARVPDILTDAFRGKAGVFDIPQIPQFPQEAPEVTVSGLPEVSSSRVMALLQQIQAPGPSEYAVINLETGRSWLTTRLFLFAVLLRRMRALRALVFVESREGVAQRFAGVASPDVVRWRLAREYPWLERAFARAYAGLPDIEIRSDAGALDPPRAASLIQAFMDDPEISVTVSQQADEWEPLFGTWEHARWITRAVLDRVLDLSPARSSVMDAGDLTEQARTLAVLRAEGDFVALVDPRGGLQRLVDRQALLERVARRQVAAA